MLVDPVVGVAYVRGVIGRDDAAVIEDRVWTQLERRGFLRDDRSTWPVGFLGHNQGMRHAKLFDAFAAPTAAIVDELLEGDASPSDGWAQALISFPEEGDWDVQHRTWHFDLPGRGDPDAPAAARLFGFVVDVEPRGGGTLVIEGSHEVVRRMVACGETGGSSKIRKRFAARHPWFRALFREGGGDRTAQFMVDGDEVDGVRVRVAELHGSAGDVAVMLPWTIHAISKHSGDRPRFVANHSSYRTGTTIFEKTA